MNKKQDAARTRRPANWPNVRGTAWAWLLITPPALVLLWHLRNRGWPSDDSANMMLTAYQQYLVFCQSGILHGLQGLYAIRGWRPVALPPLAVPFLLLFHGKVLAAASAVLSLAYVGWVAYVFAIARLYLARLPAALATAATVTFPAFVSYDLIFNTEGWWLFASFGWLYHSLASRNLRRTWHAALAGLMLGLAMMLRHVETSVMAILPCVYLAAKALKTTGWQAVFLGAALLGSIGAALVVSAFVAGLDRDKLLAIGEACFILWLLALRGNLRGFSLFCGTLGGCVLGWWAGFMPALYGWVYTTSFGPMAQVLDHHLGVSIATRFYQTFAVYLAWQILGIALLGAAILLLQMRKPLQQRIGAGIDDTASLMECGWLAAGILLPIMLFYALTGTTDPRRAIIGVAASTLTFAIAAARARPAWTLWPLLAAATINSFALVAAMRPGMTISPGIDSAFRLDLPQARLAPDEDPALISALVAAGVAPNTAVAVYTLALFYAPGRVYEPAALGLAAVVNAQAQYQIGYLWDEGDYAGVLKRLHEQGYRYLVLDLYPGPGGPVTDNPYCKFTSHLLEIYNNGAGTSPGLQPLKTWQLGGRAHELFAILPPS